MTARAKADFLKHRDPGIMKVWMPSSHQSLSITLFLRDEKVK